MKRVERIANVIGRKPEDYLLGHIVFSDRSRIGLIEEEAEIDRGSLDAHLDNHLEHFKNCCATWF